MEVVVPVFEVIIKTTSDLFILLTHQLSFFLLLGASKENVSAAPQQPSRLDSISKSEFFLHACPAKKELKVSINTI